MQGPTSKDILKTLAITFVFNSLIAVVLTAMVLGKQQFLDVFIISQSVGLSICTIILFGIYLKGMKISSWRPVHSVLGLLAGIFIASVLSWGYLSCFRGMSTASYIRNVFSYLLVFGIVFGVPIIYFFTSREKIQESEKQVAKEKIKRLTIEKEAAEISLRLIQAQIEPHFLFNTLSNVILLFDMDVKLARHMLVRFNEFLRISFQITRQEMIPLSQELDLVKQYLEIFKIRLGDRLSYEVRDETGISDLPFPPLTIQPLVENSIKYGIEPSMDGGAVTVLCRVASGMLEISVSDTGEGLEENANKAGIGINNVSCRLEQIYGSKAGLNLVRNEPRGMTARIWVPI